ncbi:MAG: pyruvate formate lyase family protein [Planctomycetota bacterium]
MTTAAPEPFEATFGVVTGVETPRRLSEATRRLAARYLCGEIGATTADPHEKLRREDFAEDSDPIYVARAIGHIARHAPLRVLPGEKLIGAATLRHAMRHRVPYTDVRSVSHTTLNFEEAVRIGYAGYRRRLAERRAAGGLDGCGREVLDAMDRCIDAAMLWHGRYIELLEQRLAEATGDERSACEEALANLRVVPEHRPETFKQALQALWSVWDFTRLCGNWSGIGRIDKILGPYLQADLDAGRITLDEAREWLAHFWIRGCEWITPAVGEGAFERYGGDAQHYQNIILAGIDEDGRDVVNEVTYLVLDVVEELHISDFPIAVRVNANTPDRLWRRIADVQRRGGGIVAIYNEPLMLEALTDFGWPRRDARNVANDGCWEAIVPGRTCFKYRPFDMLALLQDALGMGVWEPLGDVTSFEQVYDRFRRRLAEHCDAFHAEADTWNLADGPAGRGRGDAPLVSLLAGGCIERARDYHDRGADYNVIAIHAGGIPDTANSLLAIKRYVFEQQRLTLGEFVALLENDWAGGEALRHEIRRGLTLYGNDDADADAMVRRVVDDYAAIAGAVRCREGVWRPVGISTFGREIEYRTHRKATAFGARAGEILATNLGATPGTDHRGPTALINSFCKMDYHRTPNGVPLEIKLSASAIRGPRGPAVLTTLMKTFVRLGGWFLHIDAVDADTLRDAQTHPERYTNLAVRVSGWSARFTTLDEHWQAMIIQRTEHAAR